MKKFYILFLLVICCCSEIPVNNSSPNLIASSVNQKKLIDINSLLVSPVEADNKVLRSLPQNLDLNGKLFDALQNEVQIKIVNADQPGKAKQKS